MPETASSSVLRLIDELRRGARDPVEWVETLAARFEAQEARYHAFVEEEGRFERLRREAERLRERYPDPSARPALYGVPVGVKDVIHAEGFETRAGSTLPAAKLAGEEADCVKVLKASGALILGKTACTELAFYAPGPTRNPRAPQHTPGGSSSGSAAAVAAGLCPIALGTQTIGSITRPAAYCGVVGYKPTYDRIPRRGVVPLAPSLDHVGVLSADVASAEVAAGLLCRDWRSVESLRRPVLKRSILRGPVLGVPEGSYLDWPDAVGSAHFRKMCDLLRAAGYTVRAVEAMSDFDGIVARHHALVAAEAVEAHGHWLNGDHLRSATRKLLERGLRLYPDLVEMARRGREELRRELMQLMDDNGVDLWISPAAQGVAPRGLESTGDPVMSLPWSHAGLPTVCLPAGEHEGLPLGLQVTGWWGDDAVMLAWAKGLETVLADVFD